MQLKIHSLFATTAVVFLALVGCATPTGDNGDLSLENLAIRHRICSIALATVKNRHLHSIETASGCQAQMVPTRDTVFEVASLSKPVFAYAVLKLVEQGKLTLDAPIAKYLPKDYAKKSPFLVSVSDFHLAEKLNTITVRMALNHTSGLPNFGQKPPVLQANPGERWLYSGWGYTMLQKAVEEVTQQSLEKFMAITVFEPLGMGNSSYVFEPRFADHFAAPRAKDTERIERPTINIPVAAYSLYSSVEDYGRFMVAVLNDAKLLASITDNAVIADTQLKLAWGLGWGIEPHADGTVLWHWGNNPGYRAFVIVSPQTGDGLVMLTNSNGGLALAEPLVRRLFLGRYKIFSFI